MKAMIDLTIEQIIGKAVALCERKHFIRLFASNSLGDSRQTSTPVKTYFKLINYHFWQISNHLIFQKYFLSICIQLNE